MPRLATRILPFARLGDVQEIDDCREVYADRDTDDFGTIVDFCDRAPASQHEYSMRDNFQRCIHCGERNGL